MSTSHAFAAVAIVVMAIAFNQSWLYVLYALVAGGLIWLFHFDNIQRLLNGTERRIELRR